MFPVRRFGVTGQRKLWAAHDLIRPNARLFVDETGEGGTHCGHASNLSETSLEGKLAVVIVCAHCCRISI